MVQESDGYGVKHLVWQTLRSYLTPVVTMLLHCCYTIVPLLLHCCYTVVTLLLQGEQLGVAYTDVISNTCACCSRVTVMVLKGDG
jgi:hypothetical protein